MAKSDMQWVSQLPDCPHAHGRVVLASGADVSATDALEEMLKANMGSCLMYVSGALTLKTIDEATATKAREKIGTLPSPAEPVPAANIPTEPFFGPDEEKLPSYESIMPPKEPPPGYTTTPRITPERAIEGEQTSVSHVADKNTVAVMMTIRFSEATLRAIAKQVDEQIDARRAQHPTGRRKDGVRAMHFAHRITHLVAVARRRIAYKALTLLQLVSEVCPVGAYSTEEVCFPIEVTEVERAKKLTTATEIDALTKDCAGKSVGHPFRLLKDGAEFSIISCNTCTTDGNSVTVLHDVAVLQHGPASAVVTVTESEPSSTELTYLTYGPAARTRRACHHCMHSGKSPWFEEQFAALRSKANAWLTY